MLKDLIKLANTLDSLGLIKEADFLDSLAFGGIKKFANVEWFRDEPGQGRRTLRIKDCKITYSDDDTPDKVYMANWADEMKKIINGVDQLHLTEQDLNKILSCLYKDGYYYAGTLSEDMTKNIYYYVLNGQFTHMKVSGDKAKIKPIEILRYLYSEVPGSITRLNDQKIISDLERGPLSQGATIREDYWGKVLQEPNLSYEYYVEQDGKGITFTNKKTKKSGTLDATNWKDWEKVVQVINTKKDLKIIS